MNQQKNRFATRVFADPELNSTIVELTDTLNGTFVEVCPGFGGNMRRFCVNGRDEVLQSDPKTIPLGQSGIPVLFPSPNRLLHDAEDGEKLSRWYRFEGKKYRMRDEDLYGVAHLVHGLVFDQPWRYSPPVVTDTSARVHMWFDIDATSSFYENYPFASQLTLDYILDENGITVEYSVTNNGDTTMPFGLGFHPYFNRLSGADTRITIPAKSYLITDSELIPTGQIAPSSEVTSCVPGEFMFVGEHVFDHDFTDISGYSRIEYPNRDVIIEIKTSPDMTHLVVYTPTEGSFAIEPQTCSINAINLHDKGFEQVANLITLAPNQCHKGWVKYEIK